MVRAGNQKITNKEQPPRVAELREELRHEIAAHTPNAGAHATAILGLTLYRRTAPSPSLNVFVQGRKRITLAGTIYRCDESTFLLSSIDVPIVSKIVAASEDVPLLSLLLKLDMAVVREILTQDEFHARDGSSPVSWHHDWENDRRSPDGWRAVLEKPRPSAACAPPCYRQSALVLRLHP